MTQLFAIVDLETTGGRPEQERIIEIAIALHDGEKVIDRFESLINPKRSIPYNITRITGITDEMVKDAPQFYEVAKRVVEITEGAIFVAHNVRFDYSFLAYEFKQLGYTYTRKQLCTVKMSRKAFPKLEGGHSLGNLIRQFEIQVDDRHRAMADVLATVEVFQRIIEVNGNTDFETLLKQGVREAKLPDGITAKMVDELPNETGVYYFHNEEGEIVYVGKSIHIRQRVWEHFRGKGSKAVKLMRHVRSISFELTGSELVALLLESHEIHRFQPHINKAQRGKGKPTGILQYQNQMGYICFKLVPLSSKNSQHPSLIATYDKGSQATMAMFRAKANYDLCACLLEGKSGAKSCIYQQIKQCAGAGVLQEKKETYNQRAKSAVARLQSAYDHDCLIIEQGRTAEEWAVVLIENSRYKGYGYCDVSFGQPSIEQLKNCIEFQNNNSNIPHIIRTYLTSKEGAVKLVDL